MPILGSIVQKGKFAASAFFEAVNAIGVLQVPAIISIWDDGYGISVSNEYQVTKSDISEIIKGFKNLSKLVGYVCIASSIAHMLFANETSVQLGASGVVFMLILLNSLVS